MALRALKATLVAALLSAVLAVAAHAGEYHVYSCRTPAGQVAPTDGWSAPPHPLYDVTSNTCEARGGLVAALDAGYEHVPLSENDKATWAFLAPAGETIAGATLWRAGDILGGSTEFASYVFWFSGVAAKGPTAHTFDECAAEGCLSRGITTNPMAPENRVIVPSDALNSQYLAMSTYCGSPIKTECPIGERGENRYDAIVELFAADIVLSQSEGPTVSAAKGGLAEDSTAQGTSDVSFHAADPGSGIYEAIVQVDGQTFSRKVIDEDGGRCRNVGGTTDGLPAFLYTQPCPAEVSADLPIDTTGLSNGLHHLVVSVTDAAGNAATVLDREITVANPLPTTTLPPPACTTGATGKTAGADVTLTAAWKGRAAPKLRSRYGSAHTVEGRLTSSKGAAIAGAPVEVCEVPAYAGATSRVLGTPRTNAGGDWSLALPRDLPSCALRVAYRIDPLEALPAALRTLALTVPAALRLRVSPHLARSEGAIRFVGRLLGAPIPPAGKQLVLEARSPGGRWIEFHVIRTGPRGRLRYTYRFHLPGPARYQFRAVSEPEADFPFAAGSSNVVRVFER